MICNTILCVSIAIHSAIMMMFAPERCIQNSFICIHMWTSVSCANHYKMQTHTYTQSIVCKPYTIYMYIFSNINRAEYIVRLLHTSAYAQPHSRHSEHTHAPERRNWQAPTVTCSTWRALTYIRIAPQLKLAMCVRRFSRCVNPRPMHTHIIHI